MPLNAALDFKIDQSLLDQGVGFNTGPGTEVQLFQNAMRAKQRSFFESSAYAVGGTVASVADTFLESFGVLDERDMEDYFSRVTPEFGSFFTENRQALQIAGDVVGLFVPATLGAKAIRTTGAIGKLAQATFGKKAVPFLSTGKRADDLFAPAYRTAARVARQKQTHTLSNHPRLQQIRSKLLRRRVADAVLENVAADMAIIATMHESEFLFPDDMNLVDNLLMFAVPNAIIGGLYHATGRFIMNRKINLVAGAELSKQRSHINKELHSGSPGQRGVPAYAVAWERQRAQQELSADDAARIPVRENILRATNSYDESLSNIFQLAARDAIPGVSTTHKLNSGEISTMQQLSLHSPIDLASMVTLNESKFGEDQLVRSRLARKKNEVQGKFLELTSKKDITPKQRELAQKLQEEYQTLNKYTVVTYDPDGWVSAGIRREQMYQDGARNITTGTDGEYVSPVGFKMELRDGEIVLPARRLSKHARVTNRIQPLALTEATQGVARELIPEGARGADEFAQLETRGIGIRAGTTPEKLQQQRELFPEESFVVYGRSGKGGLTSYRLSPKHDYNVPVEVTRDDVFGIRSKHLIMAAPREQYTMGPEHFRSLSHFDKTRVYGMYQHALDNVKKPEQVQIASDKLKHHTQIDYALELIDKFGLEGDDIKKALEWKSISQKFIDFQHLRNSADEVLVGRDENTYRHMENISRALNLPLGDLGRNPILDFFESVRLDGKVIKLEDVDPNLRNYDSLLASVRESVEDVPDGMQILTRGRMMGIHPDNKPVLGVIDDTNVHSATHADLMVLHAQQRGEVIQNLRESENGLISGIMQFLEENGDNTRAIKEGFFKAVDGYPISGKLADAIAQQGHLLRELPGATQANVLADLGRKFNERYIQDILKESTGFVKNGKEVPLGQIFRVLQGDIASRVMYNTYVTAKGAGWDLEANTVMTRAAQADGTQALFGWRLKNNTHNQDIWRRMFDEDMPVTEQQSGVTLGPMMPRTGEKGSVLSVPELTRVAAESMTRLSHELLDAHNAVRSARGQQLINKRDWHTPPRSFVDKERVYLLDSAGEIRYVASGATREAAEAQARREAQLNEKRGLLLTAIPEDTVKRRKEAWSEEFFLPDDMQVAGLQSGRAQGRSFGVGVEQGPALIRSQLESVFSQYNNVWREVYRIAFEPDLQNLSRMQAAAGLAEDTNSVYTQLQRALLGMSRGHLEHVVTRLDRAVESGYNKVLASVWNKRFARKPMQKISKEYDALHKTFGEKHNPYSSMLEYAETREELRIPPTLRKNVGAMNEISVAAAIRWFDQGMAFINMASLPAIIPPTVKMISRRNWIGESEAEHLQRIGATGGKTPDGVGYINPVKAMMTGIHNTFTEEGQALWKEASRRGYLDQQAAELIEVFGRTGEGFVAGMLRDVGNVVSYLTDKTEVLSRGVSFMTMHHVAKKVYGLDDGAAMTFAHDWANKVIGDFRPSNRPLIFQGAAGMPLGLFTTFMWNYLHRITNILESGSKGAAVLQFGLQGALFGSDSVPGFQSYVQNFTQNYDGTENVVDRFNNAFGPEFSDVFFNGSVSTLLPRAAGMGGGVSVGPRAAVGLPLESGIDPTDVVPGFRLAAKALQFSFGVFDSVVQEGKFNPIQAAQLLAASNVNKGVSNAIELTLGRSTTVHNDLIEKDTRTRIGVAARALGFKPLFADELKQEIYRANMADRTQANLKQRLSHSLQTSIRRGKLDGAVAEEAFHDYIIAGGTPENFRRFFTSQMVKAKLSRADREILETMQGSFDNNRAVRLLHLMHPGY